MNPFFMFETCHLLVHVLAYRFDNRDGDDDDDDDDDDDVDDDDDDDELSHLLMDVALQVKPAFHPLVRRLLVLVEDVKHLQTQ